ncbi:hypothetical protein HPB52_010797 [Rhipicephalus sanguineus]|uniref:Microplusin n=1 Tax=Rhipicephalus sanguineus TaxID=34632 RepID=A0A9D4T1T0_RHISA|nr:hypothetical protein HPB52_010797 [Rhipicephalus sanguineus]
MKVLLICGLVLVGAFLADAAGGKELCESSEVNSGRASDPAPACERVGDVKPRALEILGERGDKAADLIKTKCEADVDFETVANGIKAAYAQCKPASR